MVAPVPHDERPRRGPSARRRRRAALIGSLLVHTVIALALAFFGSTQREPDVQSTGAVDVVFVTDVPRPLRPYRSLPRLSQVTGGRTPAPRFERAESTVPQVVLAGDLTVANPANPSLDPTALELPDVATAARLPQTTYQSIPRMPGTPMKPTPGMGINTGVQRPAGPGRGRSSVESTGAARAGLPGEGNGRGRGAGSGDGDAFGSALGRIGEHVAETNVSGQADILFVVDASGSMHDNIAAIAGRIEDLTSALDEAEVTYRLSVAQFRELDSGTKLEISGWSGNADLLRQRLLTLGVLGNERALDALASTLEVERFRADADRHLLFVTDEPATTRWKAPNAAKDLEDRILQRAGKDAIHVNVMGYDEPFQTKLAGQTGGVFEPIPTNDAPTQRTGAQTEPITVLGQHALDDAFRKIAGDVSRWLIPEDSATAKELDLLLFIDVSGSMAGRLRAVMLGTDLMRRQLELAGVSPAFLVVRIADAEALSGSGVRGAEVSPLLTSIDHVQMLLQFPAVGDERLLDGIVRGLQARRRSGVAAAAIIVTDEPPTGKDADAQQVADAMARSGARFFLIGPDPASARARNDGPTSALINAVRSSRGAAFPMPDADFERLPGR